MGELSIAKRYRRPDTYDTLDTRQTVIITESPDHGIRGTIAHTQRHHKRMDCE